MGILESRETGVMSPIETYRVSAYNTSRQSENKIHDDTVARRFGFTGGLVPGVDVMAYMMHLPVRKWGRAFLERGLIEARFVKPVYDGEIAEVTAQQNDGALTIEVTSRGELCATGRASLPDTVPSFSLADYAEVAAVAERKPVSPSSYEVSKWLGTIPWNWAGKLATDYLADIRETNAIYAQEGLSHPGQLQRVMNRVLVENAILGPWIHVGSRMQLLSAAKPVTRSPRGRKSPAITRRRAIGSSNSTRWCSPMARRRSPIASTPRSISRASRRWRKLELSYDQLPQSQYASPLVGEAGSYQKMRSGRGGVSTGEYP